MIEGNNSPIAVESVGSLPLSGLTWSGELGAWLNISTRKVNRGYSILGSTVAFGQVLTQINSENYGQSELKVAIAQEFVPMVSKTYVPTGSALNGFVDDLTETRQTVALSASIPSLGINTISWESKQIDTAHKATAQQIATFGSRVKISRNELGSRITQTSTVVAAGSSVPADTATTIYSFEKVSALHGILTATTTSANGSILSRKQDELTRLSVDVLEEEVANIGPVSTTPGVEISYRQMPNGRFLKTTKTLIGFESWTRTLHQSMQITFPAVLSGLALTATFIKSARRTYFNILPNLLQPREVNADVKVHQYLITAPVTSIPTVFNPGPVNLTYSGILFNIDIRGVITDNYTLTATTNSADTYYGSVVDTGPVGGFPSSNILPSDYLDMVAAESELRLQYKEELYGFNLYLVTELLTKAK